MSIQLKIGTMKDADELAFIGEKTFRETWGSVYGTKVVKEDGEIHYESDDLEQYLNEAYGIEIIRKELEDENIIYIIARDEDKMVGFCRLSREQTLGDWIPGSSLEICRIYVLVEYQDKKAGKLMMDKSLELARDENKDSLVLGVWENNHRAVAFYKKYGFEVIGTHEFKLGNRVDTDWVMQKRLKV